MKLKKLKIVFAAVVVAFSFALPGTTHALTISPARIEISGNPGQIVSGEFTVINEQQNSQTFYSSSENFEALGESGTPSFVTSIDGLASWISVSPTVTMAKGQEQKIPFRINIPKDADPGGYFAAIFLSTNSPRTQEGQVSVGARIGLLVLLKVNGTVKEGGGLLGFTEKNGARFFTSLPITFTYRFSNSGGDRIKPDGTLVIRDMIGLSASNIPANIGGSNVLPNSTRKIDVAWGTDARPAGFWNIVGYQMSHFAFGPYFASLSLKYGSQNLTAGGTYFIFVFPWQFILVALIVITLVIYIGKNGLKRYNRWIIQKAQGLK